MEQRFSPMEGLPALSEVRFRSLQSQNLVTVQIRRMPLKTQIAWPKTLSKSHSDHKYPVPSPHLPSTTKMKDLYFSPRRTSASHQPCPTERMVNPWYFTQLRLPVYKRGYMRRFHPYPSSKRRRSHTDSWMVKQHVPFLSLRSL